MDTNSPIAAALDDLLVTPNEILEVSSCSTHHFQLGFG